VAATAEARLHGAPPLALVSKTERSVSAPRIGCPRAFVWNGYERRCDRWECPSCGPKKARETGLILMIDADLGEAPRAALTLTTQDPETSAADFRAGMAAVRKRMRRQFGAWEDFQRIEFTTGRARTSGGVRRIHGHSAVKLPASVDLRAAEAMIRETWSQSLPGNPWRVELAELRTRRGLLQYLSLHHAKASQLPPPEWRGMHDRATRGYFDVPVRELRAEARARVWSAGLAYRSGITVTDARILVDGQIAEWAMQKEAMTAAREVAASERVRWSPPEPLQLAFTDEDIPF
jgi:hypothetical protein